MTGGTGFLGSNLINKWIKNKKYKLFILHRSKSNFERIPEENLKKIYKINIDHNELNDIFKKKRIDAVVHCATNYGLKKKNISEIIQPNLILPMKLLDVAKNNKVRVFLNTDSVLNKNISNYTLSKYHFAEWLKLFSKDFYCCNIKIEHFFGPKDDESKFVIHIIKSFLKEIKFINLTKGNQKRDFIFINDVVSAIDKILNFSLKQKKGHDVFEIGSGHNISIKKIVLMIKKLCNNKKTILNFGKIKMRKNELLKVKLNLKKLKNLNWKTKYKLEESLKKTINYYKS